MKGINLEYKIPPNDFIVAGEASSNVKKMLREIGVKPEIIKRASIAMYEAEMNAVIHGQGGKALVSIHDDVIEIRVIDEGPGIENINLAMQEGYTTAPDNIREMGFGAGMGLPNIKRYADVLKVISEVNKGTEIYIKVYLS